MFDAERSTFLRFRYKIRIYTQMIMMIEPGPFSNSIHTYGHLTYAIRRGSFSPEVAVIIIC